MPIRHTPAFVSKPRGASRAPAVFRANRQPAGAPPAALLLAALLALFGCAAPQPPEPPSVPRPAAAAAPNGAGKSARAQAAASRPGTPSRPAAPQGLAAIPVRHGPGADEVDLSWAISDAANLAGYNVYRSQGPGKRGARLNPHVLAVPEFRDTAVAAGLTYRYRVTAVDAAGTESAPSAPVTVSIPAAGQGSP